MADAIGVPPLAKRASAAFPLPGGYSGYLNSLRRICQQVRKETSTSVELVEWMCETFKVSRNNATNHEGFLRKVGLIESNGGHLHLPDAMGRWLECQEHDIPMAHIHGRLRYFGEMLAETVRPVSEEKLRRAAEKYGLVWQDPPASIDPTRLARVRRIHRATE